MSSPAANKRKGAAFEIALMKALREERYLDAERLRLAGKDDEGDLVVRLSNGLVNRFLVIEAKSGAMHPAQFVREMEAERANFARARAIADDLVTGVVVVKAPRKPALQSYALLPFADFLNLLEG